MTDDVVIAALRAAFEPRPIDPDHAFDGSPCTYELAAAFCEGVRGRMWTELSPEFLEQHAKVLHLLAVDVLVEILPAFIAAIAFPLGERDIHVLDSLTVVLYGNTWLAELIEALTKPQRHAIGEALLRLESLLEGKTDQVFVTEALDTYWRSHAMLRGVRAQIIAAWRDAIYPSDDNICTPTYDDEGVSAYFRGRTWEGHEIKALRQHEVGLTFFTPEAFAYYLAAYMLAVIDDASAADVISDGIVFNLSPSRRQSKSDPYLARVACLSPAQRAAVIAYLEWYPTTTSMRAHVDRAIEYLKAAA